MLYLKRRYSSQKSVFVFFTFLEGRDLPNGKPWGFIQSGIFKMGNSEWLGHRMKTWGLRFMKQKNEVLAWDENIRPKIQEANHVKCLHAEMLVFGFFFLHFFFNSGVPEASSKGFYWCILYLIHHFYWRILAPTWAENLRASMKCTPDGDLIWTFI